MIVEVIDEYIDNIIISPDVNAILNFMSKGYTGEFKLDGFMFNFHFEITGNVTFRLDDDLFLFTYDIDHFRSLCLSFVTQDKVV